MSAIKHLRKHHAESAEMKSLKIPRPPIPCETRWNSVGDTMEYFDNHWSNIVIIVNKILKPSDQYYRYMEDVQLKQCVTDLLQMFSPINRALDRWQKDSSTLGLVFSIWNESRSNTPGQYVQQVSERGKIAMSPEILAANLLDHQFAVAELDVLKTTAAMGYLCEIDASVMPKITNFYYAIYSAYLFSEDYKNVKPAV